MNTCESFSEKMIRLQALPKPMKCLKRGKALSTRGAAVRCFCFKRFNFVCIFKHGLSMQHKFPYLTILNQRSSETELSNWVFGLEVLFFLCENKRMGNCLLDGFA